MTIFILVPGACHGGWWYTPLIERLESAGHTGIAVTPEGLDPDAAAPTDIVTLDTHVAQVVDAIDAAPGDGQDIVLVGHSYAGSLISGAADARPDRIRALVYLDAFLPEDGDSAWSMTNDEEREWYVDGAGRTGWGVDPLPFFDDRARPHPLATLLQRSSLTGAWRAVPVKIYVVALGWPGESPLAFSTARARADAKFEVREWDTRHNVMADGPDRVFDLIVDL